MIVKVDSTSVLFLVAAKKASEICLKISAEHVASWGSRVFTRKTAAVQATSDSNLKKNSHLESLQARRESIQRYCMNFVLYDSKLSSGDSYRT